MTIARWILGSSLAWICGLILIHQPAAGQSISVGNYEVLSSTRVGRTTFDFVMRATITNNSLPAQGVLARATSNSTNTIVVSRTLQFGNVGAGGVAVSTNTFTIRQNRLVPFDPASLQWAVSVQSMQLALTLDTPVSGFLTNGTNIVVSGTVGFAVTAVDVNGIRATLTASNYTALVPLIEGKNTLSAVAQNSFGGSGSSSVQVSRDTMPPIITIGSPNKGAVVSSAQITVGGNINDIVSGTVNGDEVVVTVNDIPATVANRSYVVPEILLSRGKNKITARARDRAGNESSAELDVVYQEVAAQKRIVLVGGNNQSGVIATILPDPLLVALLDANGAALTNQAVTFSVAHNDGLILSAPKAGRDLTVLTDDKGLASVLLQLGTRTGAGNNQVAVTAPGVVGEVVFSASSLVGPPVRINALLPETQVGETGRRLPSPWIVFVTDAGGNPVAAAPVTFTVSEGRGGMVNGAPQVTRTTDSDGKVSVIHTLGSDEGINNNVVVAQLSTRTNDLVTFKASALTAQRAEDTRVVGLVLDNANQPMTNIFCGITGTRLITLSDQHGQFVISNAPVGALRLFVDARERGYAGTWEVLEFDLVAVAGRANSVDRPIYMLPLDDAGSALAGGAQEVTLQMKGIPGATMTIFPNSVYNANGDRVTERVMFTQVNAERLPMPPPRGSQFMLAWTVQPAGLRFNPPARMCIPNNGLPPGQVIELFSFDHDLVQFAAIGTARVSSDGSQICSDAGFGVIKSGWGGGGPPPPPPCTAACSPAPADTDCTKHKVAPATTPCGCPTYTPDEDKKPQIITVEPLADGTNELVTVTNKVIQFRVKVTHTNCSNLTYEWNFDDGATSTQEEPIHKYANIKTFYPKVAVKCGTCAATRKEEKATVIVTGLNLVIHKPLVIDPGQSAIPNSDKLSKGSQTFVNLDNDDGDANFDTGTTDSDVAGENEMVKLKLQLTNKDVKNGKVKLEASAGGGSIKIWKKITKTTEFASGNELTVPTDFTLMGTVLEAELYVEGIAPHTAAQGTKLKMTYDQASTLSDEVSLTIIGIESLVWEGVNNSVNNNNTLDADPNYPGGLGVTAVRVFPDARDEGFFSISPGPQRDKVNVKATLSVAPIEPVNLFFKSFDVDDPTASTAPVDDDTVSAEDNRGTSPAKAGKITGSDGSGVLTLLFDVKEKTFEFQTAMQPGDNFRIAGAGDKNAFTDLANDDTTLTDRQRIVNTKVSGTDAQKEIRDAGKYCSPVLTVWRFLHIEADSMGVVANNFQDGNITALETGVNTTATRATVSTSPGDLSNDLDSATAGNGRFENGTLRVANTHNITLTGNGANDVRRTAGLNVCATPLPFVATDNDFVFGSTMAGTVTAISSGSVVLTLNITSHSETPIDWPDFIGGTIRIGGGPDMNITAVNSNLTQVTVSGLLIPYHLTDDDVITGDLPQPDTGGMAPIWAPAYVLPLFDTGKDSPSVTFVLNSADADKVAHIQSGKGVPLGVDKFWIVTVLNAYQSGPESDNDPDSEGTDRAVSYKIVDGVIMTLESIRDWSATPLPLGGNGVDPAGGGRQTRYREILNHEIGHQFGQDHDDGGVTAADPLGGVEAPSCCPPDSPAGGTRGASTFTQIGLDRIRSRNHPGKP